MNSTNTSELRAATMRASRAGTILRDVKTMAVTATTAVPSVTATDAAESPWPPAISGTSSIIGTTQKS